MLRIYAVKQQFDGRGTGFAITPCACPVWADKPAVREMDPL
jgi:hypothetical protein